MISISLCMIVRNEEEGLFRCLSSVKEIVDEIVIVDTGSTDNTKEVASQFGAVLYDFEWIDNFAAARNYAFSQATQEYILWLDADDTIKEKDLALFKELKVTLSPEIHRVTMPYNLAFDSDGNVTSSLRRNRLVRRDCHFQWIGPVHEYLEVSGNVYNSEVCITHKKDKAHTDRNLRIYRNRVEQGEQFSPRDLYYYANELRDHAFYQEAAAYYEQFLNTEKGWVEDNIQACMKLADCQKHLGDPEKEFQAFCKTLQYDLPRAEFCCQAGAYFVEKGQYRQGIYWYKLALQLPTPEYSMGITNRAASTWVPHLQLCLCYDRMGDHLQANEHNELALSYAPSHPSMLYNRKYFQRLFGPE